MKLQFDANQEYQLDAIKAAVDLFAGQLAGAGKDRKAGFWAKNGHCKFTPWLGEVTS